jgi:hypothetical protein
VVPGGETAVHPADALTDAVRPDPEAVGLAARAVTIGAVAAVPWSGGLGRDRPCYADAR